MLRLLLVVALLPPQDDDLRALVRRLGDDRPETRDQAALALETRGTAALEALRNALDDDDLEVRERAQELMDRIDPATLLQRKIVAQRPRKVRKPGADAAVGSRSVETDGARFHFWTMGFAPDGKVVGTILQTSVVTDLDGQIEWAIASVTADRDLPFERCATHSPEKVFVPGDRQDLTVVVKGTRRWFCDVPVAFSRPQEGDQRRVGPFTVTLTWPHIVLQSDHPLPPPVVTAMLGERDILALPQIARRFGRGEPDDEPAIFFPEAKEGEEDKLPVTWCACLKEPNRSFLPPATSQKRLVAVTGTTARNFKELTSLSLLLHVPVEEPFEVTSPAPK